MTDLGVLPPFICFHKQTQLLFYLFAILGTSFFKYPQSQKPRHLQRGVIKQTEFSSKRTEVFDNAACLGGRKGAVSGFLHTAEPSHL